jgi:integrase
VRVNNGPRVRIRSGFGTSEFDAEYQAALAGTARPGTYGSAAAGTLAWLIERYRETAAWQQGLSQATRRQRENIFKQVIKSAGDKPYTQVTTETIIAGRERRGATPHQARHFLDAMRGLFRWAKDARHVKRDPTEGVANLPRRKGSGFRAWTGDDVAAYWRKWPLGTHERVWLDVILYTGLRRGDAVRLGRQHVRNGEATIKTEKSQGQVEVTLPILPVLARTLSVGPCGDLAFICGKRGKPLTKEAFGNMFKKACRAAGVPGSAHGIRKIAAATAAMNGATTEQLKALFGWTSDSMPALYVKSANRARMARSAAHLLIAANETNETNRTESENLFPHL